MNNRLLTLGFIFLAFMALLSCKKDESDYRLTVIVTAHDSVRVANAFIHLYAPVSGTFIDYYDATDENGEKYYEFSNKVIVEIVANKGSFKGCSFAEVNAGDNVVVVDVKPYGVTENGCSKGL